MQPVILDTDLASLSHKGRLPDPLATRLIGRRPLICREPAAASHGNGRHAGEGQAASRSPASPCLASCPRPAADPNIRRWPDPDDQRPVSRLIPIPTVNPDDLVLVFIEHDLGEVAPGSRQPVRPGAACRT